jgi:hypothetical protein
MSSYSDQTMDASIGETGTSFHSVGAVGNVATGFGRAQPNLVPSAQLNIPSFQTKPALRVGVCQHLAATDGNAACIPLVEGLLGSVFPSHQSRLEATALEYYTSNERRTSISFASHFFSPETARALQIPLSHASSEEEECVRQAVKAVEAMDGMSDDRLHEPLHLRGPLQRADPAAAGVESGG